MSVRHFSLFRMIAAGLVLILPVLLLGVIAEILYGVLAGWITPLLNALPGIVLKHELSRFIAVVMVLLLLALAIGALAGTAPGKHAGHWVELTLLRKVPFYNALRAVVIGLTGGEGSEAVKAVMVTVDQPGLQQFGIRMETLSDGRSVVFLPGSPNPGSGTVVIVTPERLDPLDIPPREVLRCLSRWGHGSGGHLEENGEPASQGLESGEEGVRLP